DDHRCEIEGVRTNGGGQYATVGIDAGEHHHRYATRLQYKLEISRLETVVSALGVQDDVVRIVQDLGHDLAPRPALQLMALYQLSGCRGIVCPSAPEGIHSNLAGINVLGEHMDDRHLCRAGRLQESRV